MLERNVEDWGGLKVVDSLGNKVGTVEDVYIDEHTQQPEWLLVDRGLISGQSLVPIVNFSFPDDDTLQLPFSEQQIKDAPDIDIRDELSEQDERLLYDHFGVDYSEQASPTLMSSDSSFQTETSGGFEAEPNVEPDVGMTRSEEELGFRKERQPREVVRLKKRIVTEPVQKTVPVEREEVSIEREPITAENIGQATSGPEMREGVHEEVLSSEEVIPEKRVEPKERVRLDKEQVSEDREISEDVRREEIDVERDKKDRAA